MAAVAAQAKEAVCGVVLVAVKEAVKAALVRAQEAVLVDAKVLVLVAVQMAAPRVVAITVQVLAMLDALDNPRILLQIV